MSDVALMVLPGSTGGPSLQILAAQGGYWRVLPPAEDSPLKALLDWRLEVDQMLNKVMDDIDKNAEAHVTVSLQTAGDAVARMLLSVRLREILNQAAAGPTGTKPEPNRLFVQMDKSLDWIPWEILYDTDSGDFLSTQFLVVRLPILGWSPGSADPDLNVSPQVLVSRVFHVMGKGLDAKAPIPEWKLTFVGLPGGETHQQSLPSEAGGWADFPRLEEVLEKIQYGIPDIIHFTCHGGIDEDKGTTFWTLDPSTTQPREFWIDEYNVDMVSKRLKMRQSHPLVFGNACASAKANPSGKGSLQQGLGTFFMSAGASNFIGTFAPVSQNVAIRFAREFYKLLLQDGLSVGHALWNAKVKFAAENDPSARFYCLYGPPGTHYKLD